MALAQSSSSSKNSKPNVSINGSGDAVAKPTTFHDFLGKNGSAPPFVGGVRPPTEAAAPSALSERNTTSHLEGIPFYGSRGDSIDNAGAESSSRFPRASKRSRSDSLIMVSARDRNKLQVDSQDRPVLTKLLRYSGGEWPRRPHDEEATFKAHQMRPVLPSLAPQPSTSIMTAEAVNAGPMLQHGLRITQAAPFAYQTASNKFKDTNNVPSITSQIAADEGSRTGIKGSIVLSLANAAGAAPGRQPAGVLVRLGKQNTGIGISEPESSSAVASHHGTQSPGNQMTIFYHGQAHVFDNVHPSKADAIMALAGSNGGSWSTSYASDSAAKQSSRENNDACKEVQGRPSDKG